jgi:hypothetical protein
LERLRPAQNNQNPLCLTDIQSTRYDSFSDDRTAPDADDVFEQPMLFDLLVRHIWRVIFSAQSLKSISEAHSPDVSGLFVLGESNGWIQGGQTMADETKEEQKQKRALSLDEWAVGIALLLAALVRLGVLKHIAW